MFTLSKRDKRKNRRRNFLVDSETVDDCFVAGYISAELAIFCVAAAFSTMQLRAAHRRVDSGDACRYRDGRAEASTRFRFFQTPHAAAHLVQSLRTMNLIHLDPRLRLKISESRLSSCIPFSFRVQDFRRLLPMDASPNDHST